MYLIVYNGKKNLNAFKKFQTQNENYTFHRCGNCENHPIGSENKSLTDKDFQFSSVIALRTLATGHEHQTLCHQVSLSEKMILISMVY